MDLNTQEHSWGALETLTRAPIQAVSCVNPQSPGEWQGPTRLKGNPEPTTVTLHVSYSLGFRV